jgi:hypothetical protein
VSEEGHRRRRPEKVKFQPRFTVMVLWLFLFTLVYGTLLAAPALWEAYQTLPAGSGPLTEQERALAEETARQVLSGERLRWALLAAVVTVGLGAWSQRLPGLR